MLKITRIENTASNFKATEESLTAKLSLFDWELIKISDNDCLSAQSVNQTEASNINQTEIFNNQTEASTALIIGEPTFSQTTATTNANTTEESNNQTQTSIGQTTNAANLSCEPTTAAIQGPFYLPGATDKNGTVCLNA